MSTRWCGRVCLALALHSIVFADAQPATLHVLKIAAGPAGTEEKGVFVLTEERSAFNRSDDREVIVYFQWEGVPGPHKMVGVWRSPDGGLSSSSTIDYVAKDRRFGAYWRLPISPSVPLGTWSIEATVDGQPGGRFTFEVTDTKAAAVATKRALTQAELYERLTRIFVFLHRATAVGRDLDSAAGFTGSRGQIFTSMAAVDDVDHIRAILPGGTTHPVTALAGWHRIQGWAVLQGPGEGSGEPLPVAAPNATQVGDRCFSVEGTSAGARTLVDGSITGKGAAGSNAPLLATFVNGNGTPGAPVMNEYGELIGMVGGGTPGVTRLYDLLRLRAQLKGVPIVPLTLVRLRPDAPPAAMADLRAKGELILALSGDQHVQAGGFARAIAKGATVAPSEQRDDFSVRDKGFVVFVSWYPQERVRGMMRLRMLDADNRVVLESKPKKTDLRKQNLSLSAWEVPMLATAGSYRAEVMLDDKPMWRGFVQITP